MGFALPLGLGVVAGVVLFIVTGEVFYLFYWRKRPLYPRGNSVPVAPVTEAEGELIEARESAETPTEVIINVQCGEYQIAALHQDLVEKLFPALGVTSAESTQDLMGQTRMLFTIREETKEELDRLDLDNKRSRRPSRSKSMSDISLSPVGPRSPIASTPFITPSSSPDHFLTPYGTPTYSPLVTLNRSLSASPTLQNRTPTRIPNDHLNGLPPEGPPSPTRPSFPFLSRGNSPTKSPDFPPNIKLEAAEWRSPHRSNKVLPNNNTAAYYSPPRKPFIFATPVIHGKQVEGGPVKVASPLRSCTYVYENGTFSPCSSPQCCSLSDHLKRENQELKTFSPSTPPLSPPTGAGPGADFFNNTFTPPPVDTAFSTSPSCKPSSQRSSSMLFPSSFSRPSLTPILANHSHTISAPSSDSSSPTESTTSRGSSWDSMCTPFILESSNSSAH